MTLDLDIARALGIVTTTPQVVCRIWTDYKNSPSVVAIPADWHSHAITVAIPVFDKPDWLSNNPYDEANPWYLLVTYSETTERWHVKYPIDYDLDRLNQDDFDWRVTDITVPPDVDLRPFKTL